MTAPEAREVHLRLTVGQASAVREALEVYFRLCLGQIEAVAGMVGEGVIPMGSKEWVSSDGRDRVVATSAVIEHVDYLAREIKRHLGYPTNGSHGVGHPHVPLSGHRAYEVFKVLAQALAVERDPHPGFRGVDYDGLTVRYTQDPAPRVEVSAET